MPSKSRADSSSRRSRSRGRSKSPARVKQTKSRSKSPARSKSGRSARSKSPARSKAAPPKKTQRVTRSRSPARQSKPKSASVSPKPVLKVEKIKEPTPKATSTPKSSVSETRIRSSSTRVSARLAEKAKGNEFGSENESKTKQIAQTSITTSRKSSKSKEYEFGGPFGTFFLMVLMPLTVIFINYACNKNSCTLKDFTKVKMPTLSISTFFNTRAALVYLGWFAFHVVLAILPFGGKTVTGMSTPQGKLKYRCNGLFSLVMSLALFGGLVYFKYPVRFVYDNLFQLACTACVFSFVLSILLFIKSRFASSRQIVSQNNTGCWSYDFFMGRELNPRVGPLDLKFFCELRPGLIGWLMINLCMCAEACAKTHGSPPLPLILLTICQGVYILDALVFEECILTTMDIVRDGFGFMLAFGDLAWVPFLYCLQGKYLLEHGTNWNLPITCAIFALNFVGYGLFRCSNSLKNNYRRDPHDPSLANLQTISTPSGRRLIVSSWWGICRHPNYLGDLIMGLSWSLFCGTQSLVPYFYPLYFLILLVHRSRRDNAHCAKKHGTAWDKYCQRVKYTIIPYVY